MSFPLIPIKFLLLGPAGKILNKTALTVSGYIIKMPISSYHDAKLFLI